MTVALQPAIQTVAPEAEFDLYLQVTQSGSAFNGFDAIVGYTPSALTLVPLSQQEGALMTGACATRFHRFRTGVDRDTITDVLLCSEVFLTGPGQIYRLHFRAATTPQTTAVQFMRRLASGWFAAGRRHVTWDGRDGVGRAPPPGIYYARLSTPSGITRAAIVRLR